MKFSTPFLIKFAISSSILTVVFRGILSYGVSKHLNALIITSAILYGIAMFVIGKYFGKKDHTYLPILDIGFRSHLVTYIIYNFISIMWFLLGLNAAQESIVVVYNTALIWGIFLVIHFIFYIYKRKDSINSLNKKDIFE